MTDKIKDNAAVLMIIVLLVFYAVIPVFSYSKQDNDTSETSSFFDSITFEAVSIDTEFEIRNIQTLFDEHGNKFLRVVFRSNTNEEIICEIPEQYSNNIDKQYKYLGHIELVYANEYYDKIRLELENTYGTKFENIIDLVKTYHDGYRITGVEFMFKDYIVTKLYKSNQEAENDLIKTFVNSN